MKAHHDKGCAGINMTYYKLNQLLIKLNQSTETIKLINKTCEYCPSSRPLPKHNKNIRFISFLPYDVLYIDLKQIPFICSYKYILNIKDHLSKKLYSYASKDKTMDKCFHA
jgi:hypothetical protein